MVTDLGELRRLAGTKEAENLQFRRTLIARHISLEPFRILAAGIERQIDCTQCANCCRTMAVDVSESEIVRIADFLRVTAHEITGLYTDSDPDEPSRRTLRNEGGCVFLDGNVCIVYEARPAACRDFPHIAPHGRSLGGRFSSLCRNAAVCPIIYNALEAYKHLVHFTGRHVGAKSVT